MSKRICICFDTNENEIQSFFQKKILSRGIEPPSTDSESDVLAITLQEIVDHSNKFIYKVNYFIDECVYHQEGETSFHKFIDYLLIEPTLPNLIPNPI